MVQSKPIQIRREGRAVAQPLGVSLTMLLPLPYPSTFANGRSADRDSYRVTTSPTLATMS